MGALMKVDYFFDFFIKYIVLIKSFILSKLTKWLPSSKIKSTFESEAKIPIAPDPKASKTLVLIIPKGEDVCNTHFEFERILK